MDGEIGALADIATGAVLAGAVEPVSGASGLAKTAFCLNCAGTVTARYCGNCGQKVEVHRTLSAFWHDLVHSVFHFDGKIWRTLPALAFKPGDLTRRYVHGERARFVSPLALFLFTVFLMFAALSWVGTDGLNPGGGQATASKMRTDLSVSRIEWRNEIAEIEKEIAQAPQNGDSVADLNKDLAQRKAEIAVEDRADRDRLAGREKAERELASEVNDAREKVADLKRQLAEAERLGQPVEALREQLSATEATLPMLETASRAMSKNAVELDLGEGATTGVPAIDEALAHIVENPQLFLYKMQSSAYKYSWMLILFSTPFMWLLFAGRRDVKLFDHAVFVTYSICFMIMLFTFCMLLGRPSSGAAVVGRPEGIAFGGPESWVGWLALLAPIHIYKQLKHAYRLERSAALWRTFVLGVFIVIVLLLFSTLVLVLGATG